MTDFAATEAWYATDVEIRAVNDQTLVSKYESGERILDLPELRQVCHMFGLSIPEFAEIYEQALRQTEHDSR